MKKLLHRNSLKLAGLVFTSYMLLSLFVAQDASAQYNFLCGSTDWTTLDITRGTGGVLRTQDYTTGSTMGLILGTANANNSHYVFSSQNNNAIGYFRIKDGTNEYGPPASQDVSMNLATPTSINVYGNQNGSMKINSLSNSNRFFFKVIKSSSTQINVTVFEMTGTAVLTPLSTATTTRNCVAAVGGAAISGTSSGNFLFDNVTSTNNVCSLNVTLPSALRAAGQSVYLRYTNNAFSTSTVATMTLASGNTYTASIPATTNTLGATVSYYFFTGPSTGVLADGSNADLYTLDILNNGGTNYAYTVSNTATFNVAASTWHTPTSWNCGRVPGFGHNAVFAASGSIGSGLTATCGTLTINTGVTFTARTAGTTTLVFDGYSNSATLITLTGTGTYAVGSAANATTVVRPQTATRSVTMCNAGISMGIDSIGMRLPIASIATNTVSVNMSNVTIANTGTLALTDNGAIITTAPTYGATSTLVYHYRVNPTSVTVGTEWTAGAVSGTGYPGNITITNALVSLPLNSGSNYSLAGTLTTSNNSGAGTNGQFLLNGHSGTLAIAGALTNNGGITLSSNSASIVTIAGAFTQGAATNFNNSTFRLSGNYSITGGSVTNSNATVEFTGSANTSISVPAGAGSLTFPKVNFNKTSTGTFAFTVGASTTVTVPGLTVSTNANTVTSSLFQIASGGFLTRVAGTLTGTPNFLGLTDVTYSGSTACTTSVEMPASPNINSISVSNTGGVTLGAGVVMTSGKTFTLASGGILNPGANAISGAGNFTISGGTLRVSDAGGLATSITVSGTRTWTSGTIAFTGSGTQAMGIGSNSLNTMGISVNGTTNTLTFDPTSAATIASLSISGGCTFNLNAKTLTINTASTATTLTNSGTFTHSNGKVIFAGTGVTHTVSGTLNFLDVDITPTSGLLGVNFGSGSTISTNGTLTLTTGSSVNTNAPTYATGSLLRYSNAGTFSQGSEWNNSPSNVQISNTTTLQTATNAGSPKTITGNLTIDAGSTLTMAPNNTSSVTTVGGTVTVNGTLTLSTALGGDFNVGSDLVFNTGSSFTGNTREVTFNGTGAQSISGTITTLPDFQFMQINKASGTFSFTKAIPMNNGASFARFRVTTGTVDLNGQGFTFGGAGAKQFRVDAGTVSTSGSSLTGFTEFTNNGSNVSSTLNGTINFNGAGTETLPACGMNNVNLQTSGVKSLSTNSAIAGTFSIAGTASVGGAFSLVYGSGAGLTIGSSANLTTANSFFPSSNGPAVLTISTTSGAAVTLHASRSVSTTFNFTSGDLNTGANTLTLGTSSASTGTLNVSGTGAIIGNFKRFIAASATSYVFPVGISGTRRSSTINFTGAPSVGGSLTATFVASAPTSAGLPLTQGAINVGIVATAGYWTVSAADGLTGGTYTSSFTGAGFAGISDFTKLVLVKRTNSGSNWTLDGTHVTTTGSNASPVLSRTGVTGFSDFAIGGNVSENPLPVTLLSFNASRNGSTVALKWNTACEINNNYFLIQRSVDGKAFTTINKTKGNGTSCKGFGYTAFDAEAPETVAYYKLVQVDFNGATTEFPVVKVTALGEKATNWMISVSPNPGNGNVQIVSNSLTDLVAIKITGTKGNLVETITGNGGLEVNLSQSLSKLNSGYYLIQFVNAEGMTKVVRYVKE